MDVFEFNFDGTLGRVSMYGVWVKKCILILKDCLSIQTDLGFKKTSNSNDIETELLKLTDLGFKKRKNLKQQWYWNWVTESTLQKTEKEIENATTWWQIQLLTD